MKRVALLVAVIALFIAFLIAGFSVDKLGGHEPWELAGLVALAASFLLPD